MVSAKKSKQKKVLIAIIIAIVFFLVTSFTATKIIYDSIFARYDCGVTAYPAELEQTVALRQQISFPSGENTLSGFLYKYQGEEDRNTLVILVPGHNACCDSYIWQVHELLQHGWSVLCFDPTGCCRSEGGSAVGFSQELYDMRATLDYVEKQDRFCYNDIVMLGHSRGGYAACCALSYDYDISAVVSVSGVNSAMEGIMSASVEYVGPLAYGNYGFLWLYQAMLFGSETVNQRADRAISRTDTPVLLIHGADDRQIPTDKYSIVSHRDQITGTNVEYLIRSSPDNAGHTNLLFDDDGTADNELIEKIHDFLIKHIQ